MDIRVTRNSFPRDAPGATTEGDFIIKVSGGGGGGGRRVEHQEFYLEQYS